MEFFLEALIGAIVWTFANVLYVDLRRKGVRRGRVIAFLVGYPGTLVTLFLLREGRRPRIEPPEDDEERLLREIRADREARRDGDRRPLDRPSHEGSTDGSEEHPDT